MNSLFSLYKQSFTNIQRTIWVLSIATFINRSGSMVLLFTSLYLTKELHFTIAEAGLTLGFYGVGSVLGSYVGGWLTDRKNFFTLMIFSLIISGLILLLLLLASSPLLVSMIIFAYAFTGDLFRPANSKGIAVYSTAENRTRSVSLMRLAVNLGFSIGPAIGGFVALYLGYKWLFVIDAFTSFGAAWMLFVYLPKVPNVQEHKENKVQTGGSTSAYHDFYYLIFIVLVSLFGICFFQIFASMPQYFSKECNFDEGTIGLLLGFNGLLVVVIEMPLITLLGQSKKIFRFIIIGVLCIPVSFIILMLGKGGIVAAILYTLFITLAEIFAMPFMMNYSLSQPHKNRQGQYSALYSISYGLANIAAPTFGLGIANKYGFDAMFYFFIALSIITAIGFGWLNKRKANFN